MGQAEDIVAKIERVYGDGAELDVAVRLLRFLSEYGAKHVTLHLVRGLTPGAERGDLDRSIVHVLQYFAGESVGLLQLRFEFVDEEEHPHALDDDEARAALEADIHPLTGVPDPQVRSRLTTYFEPSPAVLAKLFS